MPRLKSANFAVTELVSGVTSAATSFQVADESAFPDEGPFIILVHDSSPGFAGVKEIMEVGNIDKGTNTFSNVMRGRENTSPVAHSAGARVESVWTAGTHQELEDMANKGVAGGYASLDETGSVPATQLGNVEGMEEHGNEWHNPTFATQANLTSHLSDYTLQVPYATTTGSANIYSVLLNGVSSYYEGMAVAVKINVDNTGASTININSLGAKPIKKPNGNDISAGNLKAGSIYSMRYNGVNFILQGSDAAGDAIPGDVLSGKTFSNDEGEQTGSMTNRGAITITPGKTAQNIPAGYHNGSGQVAAVIVLENSEASDTLKISADTQRNTNQTTYTLLKNIKVARKGSIRVKFDTYCNFGGPGSGRAQIHKNGQPFGTERNASQTWTTYSEDLNVDASDQIQLHARNAFDTSYQTSVKNFRIYYDVVQATVSPQDSVITN